ncbi:MAG: hypothetical protein IKJ25_05220 [Clostridia bacterium]|nr:hypothetical protein [Clostridia bacterium]
MDQEKNVSLETEEVIENANEEIKDSTKKGLSKKAKISIVSGTSLVLVLAIVFGILAGSGLIRFTPKVVDPVDDNYRTFYQIFVGSFSDSNGDGIGDLRGIINRFDYLNDGDINSGNDLGIQGIWLSPIFESPTYHKYDAKDYYKVDEKFGTEEDLKELIALCKERNVKIILDLVINHTSNYHPWFTEFAKARRNGDTSNKYYYYYTCYTKEDRDGHTWEVVPGTSQTGTTYYYECNFSGGMPELNYDNPKVREEMLNVAKYYLDLGIDGFRFDAIKYIYYGDTKSSADFWDWYMGELTAYCPDIYCVGECWSAESEIMQYYGALNCFNFAMSGPESSAATAAKGNSLGTFLKYIVRYQDRVQEANPNGMPIQFLSNHDQDRIAGAFMYDEYKKMAANLYILSPGSPFIYYGEEIGIRGSRGGASTDANRRLAMLWGDGDTIEDPEGTTYPETAQTKETVKVQLENENSILNHYSKLIGIRNKYPAIARGEYTAVTGSGSNFGGFLVEYNGEFIGIFHNNSMEPITVDLSTCKGMDGHILQTLCDYVGCGVASMDGTVLTIDGFTSVIVK